MMELLISLYGELLATLTFSLFALPLFKKTNDSLLKGEVDTDIASKKQQLRAEYFDHCVNFLPLKGGSQ